MSDDVDFLVEIESTGSQYLKKTYKKFVLTV